MANIPTPKSAGDNTLPPFLKPAMIGKGKRTITLTGNASTRKGQFGEQVVCGVKFGKKAYEWAFGLNSGNHTRLFKRFGSNPKKWKGPITVVVKEFNGNDYIAVND